MLLISQPTAAPAFAILSSWVVEAFHFKSGQHQNQALIGQIP
jgi:hypothetical protein